MVLHAGSLDAISVDDVKRAAIGLGVLPPNIVAPPRVQLPAANTPSELDQPAETSTELTQSSDS